MKINLQESSLDYLRCVKCGLHIEAEILKQENEILEGFLFCKKCNLEFPIICGIPIMWNSFTDYLSNRRKLAGFLFTSSSKQEMRSFIKKSLSNITFQKEDRTDLEKRWADIYTNSIGTFYSKIKTVLNKIPKVEYVLEHGCSIGIISQHLAKRHGQVFGIDRSFTAILYAKKQSKENLHYFVADSISNPFGSQKFDLVLALNMLEIVEPLDLLKTISDQIKSGFVIITDPYDYDRGINSVKNKLSEKSLRASLQKFNFKIINNTKTPSYIPWKLNLNSRAQLNYKSDLIIGKK